VESIYRSYTNLTRFQTYRIALPPQIKTKERRGPQTDKHLPARPFAGQFLRKAEFKDWSLLVISSMFVSIMHMATRPISSNKVIVQRTRLQNSKKIDFWLFFAKIFILRASPFRKVYYF
jgi:hypothetical protein